MKHKVYRPTWYEAARLEYTTRLVVILDSLLPSGVEGSISTLPIAWPTRLGVPLAEDFADRRMAAVDTLPAQMTASMQGDLARGNRLEVPWLSGKVVELGKQYGIPTPTHAMMYAMLKPYAMGRAV